MQRKKKRNKHTPQEKTDVKENNPDTSVVFDNKFRAQIFRKYLRCHKTLLNQRYCKGGGFCIPLKASSSLCYRSIPDKVDRILYFLYIFPIFLGIKRLAPSRNHFILHKCQNVKVLNKDIIFLNCSLMFGHCKVEEKDSSLGTHKYMCTNDLLSFFQKAFQWCFLARYNF